MDGSPQKISHAGLLARSPEGTAAKGMNIKGNEDLWVEIQGNTFRNWVNEHLRSENMKVLDLSQDLCDGTRLCALVEALQEKRLKPSWNRRPANQHHYLENVTTALSAIEADGVKLVNIGNVDIVNGNLKLILGLIWSLIVRYQIGRSKFPPRKLMLAWLQAVLPECRVHNLTTDWNSGVLLHALLDYCKPGLAPHWRNLDPNKSVENCARAMNIANREFGIPLVLEPEYLASPWLDELSGMTYLSYFMKPDSPGFHATLRWVNSRLDKPVKGFTTEWNDGKVISEVIRSLGGSATAPEKLRSDPAHWESNLQQAVNAGQKLGVQPVLSVRDMAKPDVGHLGIMAYAAHYQWVKPRPPLADMIAVHLESTSGRVGETTHFRVELLSKELDYSMVRASIIPPAGGAPQHVKLHRGDGSYIPDRMGMHEIVLDVDENRLDGYFFRVLPRYVKVLPPGMAPCALGSLVEVLVSATGAPRKEDILVTAYSPNGRALECPLKSIDGTNSAIFKPDEAGTWEIAITYQGKHIQGGPFTCSVFDPRGVSVSGVEGAVAGRAHSFDVDTRETGAPGAEVHVDVVHDKRSLLCAVEKLDKWRHRVTFVPKQNGKHRIYVYFNGHDVKGSPFIMRVGTQKGRKSSDSPVHSRSRESPVNYKSRESPVNSRSRESPVNSRNRESPVNSRSRESPVNSKSRESPVYSTRTRESPIHMKNISPVTVSVKRHTESPSYGYDQTDHSLSSSRDKSAFTSTSNYTSSTSTQKASHDLLGSSRTTYEPRNSPIHHGKTYTSSMTSSSHWESTNRTSSPRNVTSSPRNVTSSPRNVTSSPRNVTSSPRMFSYSPSGHRSESPTVVKITNSSKQSSSNYKTHFGETGTRVRSTTPEYERGKVDHSSNVRVSTLTNGPSRRDSWDAIAKTKHLLSHNSLESLANLAESQLNTDLSYTRSEETERNTRLNSNTRSSAFINSDHDDSYRTRRLNLDEAENAKYSTKKSFSDLYTSSSNIMKNEKKSYSQERTTSPRFSSPVHETDAAHPRFRPYNQNHNSALSMESSHIGGAKAVKVKRIPDGVVGEPVEFEIDGSCAGSGNLEILVNGGRVTSSVKPLGNQRFLAAFTPHEVMRHSIKITFNGETVPGSPWHVAVMSAPGGGGGTNGSSASPASHMQSPTSASVLGDSTRLVPANAPAVFEVLSPPGMPPVSRSEVGVNVLTPSKRSVPVRVQDGLHKGSYRLEFVPTEVGTHVIEVSIGGTKLSAGPLIAKVYDAGLIQVAEVSGGVVGQPCQFRVDASAAGEGQLEISINEGEVPNHVQVVGGGRCLVSFTPDQAKPHLIDIKFNGETVQGCPFVCAIADTSRVSLNLSNLELIPVGQPSNFHMSVSGGGAAELAVSVRGPAGELPVKVTGDIHAGFTAEFTPHSVGPHTIGVDYNGYPVQGTPFLAKAYDATRVHVGPVSRGTVGRPLQFTVDAGDAGEGNLEITISARGHNIPTQVHPQGNARFSVSFVPAEACEHVVSVSFNKMSVPGCPISVSVGGGLGGPQVSLPGPGPIHKPSSLLINHSGGRLEDVEVNVEGPNGQSVPTQVQQTADGVFRAEFVPRAVGEHRITVSVQGQPTAGSPYAAKVYDVNAIRVKEVSSGTVGKPVTFLVETSQAGPGNLEVTVNGGRVPTSAQAQGQHTYAISFTPREPTEHTVDLRFNGQDVPGSPFSCRVSAAARVLAPELLDKVSVGRACEFLVESEIPPNVEVLGPARRPLHASVSPVASSSADGASGEGRFSVKFIPVDVGDHSVEVRLPGGHVEGSPFLVKAYSAERVTVTDISPGTVGKPVSFSINASQAGAGNLEIIVAVAGRNVPNYVQSEGNARFKVNFKPTEAATHSLSVRFNGLAVPGSPFSCLVSPALGPGTATVTGSGVKLAALGEEARILLDGFTGPEPQVSVTSPTGAVLRSTIRPTGDGNGSQYTATFRPDAVGRHSVAVLHGGGDMQHVAGSPFSCNVYDVRRVHVRGLEAGPGGAAVAEVGRAVTFSVDAASAGEGTLELVVSTAQNTVKAEVVACARGLYDVTFVPSTREMHFVNITFNDAPVPGSPFQCAVQENLQHVQIGGVASVEMPQSSDRTLEIIGPDGRKISYGVSRGFAEFKTSQVGQYTIRTVETESDLPLAVRIVNVYDPTLVQIVTVGEGQCQRTATLGVSTIDAGQGTLTALVRAGGEDVQHSVRAPSKPGGNTWELCYQPVKAAPHKITLMYNGVPVSERPIEVNVVPAGAGQEVTASGGGLYQARLGKVTSFSIDTLGRPAREFDVVVSGPGGVALPVRCYQTKSGLLQAEFTVTQIGECIIEVLHQAKQLSGSPYTCQSFDPSKVTVKGAPHSTVPLYSPVLLTVDHSHAGSAELDFSITGPNGQSLPLIITRHGDGAHMVELVPNAPGNYKVNILYGGISVLKTPIHFTASTEAIRKGGARAAGPGLELGHCAKEAGFTVYCPSVPSVQIESLDPSLASGADIETHIQPIKPGEWRVTYVPHSVGLYEVRVNCPGQGQVPGSPWELKVVDASQCHIVGGWPPHLDDNGNLKLPAKLIFDTSQCGPGRLECILDGMEIPIEQHGGKMRIALNGEGTAQGRCALELSYSGVPIPGAPQSAVAHYNGVGGSGEKVVLTGRGLASAQSGETAHFTIDGSQAISGGMPEVTMQSRDNGRPVEVIVTPASGPAGEEVWHAQYTPPAPGIYLLGVTWAGRVVKGCPLTVSVSGSADASRVLCSGEGLRRGVVGREIRSWIDTRRAGPGELTAHCAGPRKVAYCELYDHGDATFTLNVKPQEAGAHQLTIKYAGEHVQGSPFQLRVAGAPDASKVRVYGPGIEHGVLATFQSRFICDTRGAGAGQLTVRVRGPKGAFRVEMQRESQKDRTILCKFDPTEPGDYRVEVKWAGELVPGSPFPVMIFDTQEELRRFLHG